MSRLLRAAAGVILILTTVACNSAGCRRPTPVGAVSDPGSPDGGAGGRPSRVSPRDLEWLVANSPLVFSGSLASQRVERDSEGRVITRNVFKVANRILGDASGEEVTLTTFGGTIGDETVSASHVPEFFSGQSYVIFTDPARTSYVPTTGGDAGVFLVVGSAVYSYAGAGLSGVRDGRLQFDAASLDRMPGLGTRNPITPMAGEPAVGGNVTGIRRSRVGGRRPLQLTEFTQLIVAARR